MIIDFADLKEKGLIEFGTINNEPKGGQSTGQIDRTVFLDHKGIGVKIEISNYKSSLKNLRFAQELMEFAIMMIDENK